METISIKEIRESGYSWMKKDNSPRGCECVPCYQVNVGDEVVHNNHFVLVVDDEPEAVEEEEKEVLKNWNIQQIEKLTETEAQIIAIESTEIKEHVCYFVDFGGYFGYSVLVFRNGHHIKYVNDYELHHSGKSKEDLKQIYIDKLNKKLFTESEILEGFSSYDEYNRKDYYLRNYWSDQFDNVSIFYIGEPSPEQNKAKNSWFFCKECFCYFRDENIVKRAAQLMDSLKHASKSLLENPDLFREMISYELANHEACISYDYRNTLDSLGLRFESLKRWQQAIVIKELNRQVESYGY